MTEYTLIGYKKPVEDVNRETGTRRQGIYLFFTSQDNRVVGTNVDKIVVWENEAAYDAACCLEIDGVYDIRFSRYGNNRIESFEKVTKS